MRLFATLRGTVFAGTLLIVAGPLHATTFCVHNNAELGSALFTAKSNGSVDSVRLAQGTYALTSNFSYSAATGDNGIALSGGWNSACSLRTPNAANTVIDGGGNWSVFATTYGSFTLDNIHVYRTPIVDINADVITIRRNRFTSTSGADDAVQFENSSGSVLLDSNLFNGKNVTIRSFDGTSDAPPLDWKAINNTFVGAVNGPLGTIFRNGYGLFATRPGSGSNLSLVLANNIAWDNSNGGVYFDGSAIVLATHNQWQSLTNANNVPLANGSGGNSTANPQLDANLRPIEPGSPVINTGTSVFPGGVGESDVTGAARTVGSQPDRGAFESAANDEAIITVTTTADSGDCTGPGDTSCSLRGALTAAAAAGAAQRIEFNIPGTCPRTINIGSALPQVDDILTIDGYTQPGSRANTLDVGSDARLCVILRGNYTNSRGLLSNNANAIMAVKGLAFENFGAPALEADAGNYHAFYGNQFGGPLTYEDNTGIHTLALDGNARAIRVGNSASRIYIGGPDAAQRNVIAGSTTYAIALTGSIGHNYVRNNYVGLAPDGATAAPNVVGVIVQSPDNDIDGNVIAANTNEGLRIEGTSGNAVHGNLVGLPAQNGAGNVGNGGPGIRFARNTSTSTDPVNNDVGVAFTGVIDANIIADNGINGYAGPDTGYGGVSVEAGAGNRLTGNLVFANYGVNIDLGADGPTGNDADDSDTGPNALQNFPVLLGIRHVNGARKLDYSLYTANSFSMEVFGGSSCGAGDRGNAATVLSLGGRPYLLFGGAKMVNASRDLTRGPGTGPDLYCRLSATATSLGSNNGSSIGDTSELSACFVDDTIWAQGFDGDIGWACAP